MKKAIFTFIYLYFTLSSLAQNPTAKVEITGKVLNVTPNRKIYLQAINGRGNTFTIDSATVNANKAFRFSSKIEPEGGYYLLNFFDLPLGQKILLILEPGDKVEVLADGMDMPQKKGKYQINSSSPNIVYFNQVSKITNDLQAKIEVWNKQVSVANDKKDNATIERIQKEFTKAQGESVAKIKALLPAMGTRLVALWAVGSVLDPESDLDAFIDLAKRFEKEKPNTQNPHIKAFISQVQRMKGLEMGSIAPEIALKTPDDKIVTLSSYRGKYVLIDFWASWCGPCRRENPNVVRIYNKFKDKGFDILGVSLDQDKTSWTKAIEKDGLVWKHVSDLQYWNSVAAAAYGVQAIPAQFLVDKDGKLIAKFVGGSDELEAKLTELLK